MAFASDAAIESRKEDRLNRYPFSEHLGNAILNWTNIETMVLGLYGEWGAGKSSIINLSLEYIIKTTGKDNKTSPIIFRFNPWNFTEQNQLVTIFFSELSKVIGFQGNSEQATEIGKKLLSYSKFFTPLTILAPFFPQFAELMKLPESTLKEMGNATKEWSELNDKDLSAIKAELYKQIIKLHRKIIIVIDDIDRLNNQEMRQIFQLVKMNANFPNTIYILSLDDQKVAAMLTEDKFPGKDYLEKIIQVPFHVPTIEKARLEKILFKELDSIIKPLLSKSTPFEKKRWQDIYFEGLSGVFPSLRSVKRYINSLRFTIMLVPNEINIVDFMGIESLRVFFPEVYTHIAKNKTLFVGDVYSIDRDDRKAKVEKINKMVESVPESDRKYVLHIIYKLFPQIANNYGSEWQDIWEGQKFICSRYRYDRYFFLSVPEGQLPQQEINKLIVKSDNINDLENSLIKLIRLKRVRKFLSRLPDFKELIPQKNIANFIIAMFNISDKLPQGREHDFDFGATMEATRIAYHLLNNIEDQKTRQKIAFKVIQGTSGIIAPLEFVFYEVERMEKNEHTRLFKDNKTVEKLKEIMCKKLEERVKVDNLKSVPNLQNILLIWKNWKGDEKAKILVASLQTSTDGIGSILEGFSYQRHFGNPKNINFWDISFKSIEMFTDIEEFKKKVKSLSKEDIKLFSPQQKMALKLFNKLIKFPKGNINDSIEDNHE